MTHSKIIISSTCHLRIVITLKCPIKIREVVNLLKMEFIRSIKLIILLQARLVIYQYPRDRIEMDQYNFKIKIARLTTQTVGTIYKLVAKYQHPKTKMETKIKFGKIMVYP